MIQRLDPWVSSRDIDRGSLWFTEIGQQLGDTSVGIICLTQENKERPWILFEAGALAKGLHSSRVCTLLIDLEPGDVGDPLAQFNHTQPTKEHMRQLVGTLNSASGQSLLTESVLDRVFETYWPQFEAEFAAIIARTPSIQAAPRPESEVLAEILDNTRALSSRIRKLEERELVAKSTKTQSSALSAKTSLKLMMSDYLAQEKARSDAALAELRASLEGPSQEA